MFVVITPGLMGVPRWENSHFVNLTAPMVVLDSRKFRGCCRRESE